MLHQLEETFLGHITVRIVGGEKAQDQVWFEPMISRLGGVNSTSVLQPLS